MGVQRMLAQQDVEGTAFPTDELRASRTGSHPCIDVVGELDREGTFDVAPRTSGVEVLLTRAGDVATGRRERPERHPCAVPEAAGAGALPRDSAAAAQSTQADPLA
ncbi:hypothetical protein [Streptomyces sp. A1547]|uniref:hypothetical protein n=1 Tax=Streptomyces sp. A1547 TaxID=2563105 RepID=UPI00144A5C8A|nr:hypothetical protein [Streptomyces sp. A1547]